MKQSKSPHERLAAPTTGQPWRRHRRRRDRGGPGQWCHRNPMSTSTGPNYTAHIECNYYNGKFLFVAHVRGKLDRPTPAFATLFRFLHYWWSGFSVFRCCFYLVLPCWFIRCTSVVFFFLVLVFCFGLFCCFVCCTAATFFLVFCCSFYSSFIIVYYLLFSFQFLLYFFNTQWTIF